MWLYKAQILFGYSAKEAKHLTIRQLDAMWRCYCVINGIEIEEEKSIDDF